MRRLMVVVCVLVATALIAVSPAFSQGTDLGTIRGTVTDPSGAVIPNAKVQIVDLATNNTARELTTDTLGNYEAFGLKSGAYKATVSLPGFGSQVITGITLTGSNVARADARLSPSQTTETVMVTSEAPVIHTDDQTISQTLTTQSIVELPRDSRNIYDFVYLNPNITQGSDTGEFKFIGAQSYGGNFTLDGQRTNGGIFGSHTASQPSLEAVGELNILSNDFSAEYAGISNVRITTKRGGSDYHGSAFYNNKNSALAAWTLQDKIGQANFLPTFAQNKYPNPFFNITDIGGALGGKVPLLKNTYFFAAFERNWSANPVTLHSTTLPQASLYTGDFSLLTDAAKPAVPAGVVLTADEIANNTVAGAGAKFIRIPQRLLNPTTQKFLSTYFPVTSPAAPINAANGRLRDYWNLLPGLSVQDLGTIRVDHDFSDRDKVYAVYNVSSQASHTAAVVSPFTGLGLTQNDRLNHTLSVSYTKLVKANVVNEARGGFNQQNLLRHSNQTLRQFLTNIGFNESDIQAYGSVTGPSALDTYGHPAITFGSSTAFAAFSNGGRNTYRPLDQKLATFGDTLTWVIGKHNLRMGADFVQNQAVDGFAFNRGNPRGRINYSGTGVNAFTQFLLGLPANTVAFVGRFRPPMDVSNWEHGYFAQDDWKITSRLTLNLGVRYELITPFIDKNDVMMNFDPNYVGPNGQRGRLVIPSKKTLEWLDPRFNALGVVTASEAGVGRGLVNMDTNNVAPRFGVAYRLTDRTVVRGGYGFYYPTSAAQGIRDPLATNSFNQGITTRGSATAPLQGWPGTTHGISPVTGGAVSSLQGLSQNAVPFDLQQPRIEQYNATVEREIGWRTAVRLSYLGSKMSGLVSGRDLNMLAPNNTPFGTTTGDGATICTPGEDCDVSDADRARRPYPAFGDYLSTFGNIGHGRSNAFQTELTRRYANGIMFDVAYTLLDQKSTAIDTGNSSLGGNEYNQFAPGQDYGTDSWVSRHRVVAYGLFDLPVGRGRKYGSSMNWLSDAVVGGWQTTFNMFAKSGNGFTPFWTCDNCDPLYPGNIGSGAIDAIGDFNGPNFRPLVISGQNPTLHSGDRIFNPDAFAPPPVGADLFSNPAVAKRNMLWGPGTWGVNFGVHKTFRFGERVSAQFGADVNNLFNHPLYSPNQDAGGGGGSFANLGSFALNVDQKTGKILPITSADVTPNPDFGRLIQSFSQEGIDSRRTVRLRLRIVF